ncbi:hypothetical protein [Rhizobium sp. SEMIA 4085]|uniref:hypothetical protein n=1 Tax=Rhizobium sp. SEMIA 4085 TaxID=2137761 RepID=UPI001FF05696|nr:hypothetical protein [Rhizobium sp. SEMIA 4085]
MTGGAIPKIGAVLDIAGEPAGRDHRKCRGTAPQADDMKTLRFKRRLDCEPVDDWPCPVAAYAKGDGLCPDGRNGP